MVQQELIRILEALLFASDQPLTMPKLREVLREPAAPATSEVVVAQESQDEPPASELTQPQDVSTQDDDWSAQVRVAIGALKEKYSGHDAPVVILEVAEGWQFASNPIYAPWIKKLFKDHTSFRLSQPALETLAIIGYRQPITRAEIEELRGVEVIAALETLLERNFIKVAGRKETVGRPLLYATTSEFLRQFGLRSLNELPKLDADAEAQSIEGSSNEVAGEVSSEGPPQ